MTLPYFKTNKNWTLFLDRDGVINVKRDNDYVKTWEEFIFLDGALEAIRIFSRHFARIIVVTNQRGVGRKWMTAEDVEDIHRRMIVEIEAKGGKIDQIYYCPDLEEEDYRNWRKPKPGMAFEAKKDHPGIDFAQSLIIGDSISDMEFGRNAGMHTVWLSEKEIAPENKDLIDAQIASLIEYASNLDKEHKQEEIEL